MADVPVISGEEDNLMPRTLKPALIERIRPLVQQGLSGSQMAQAVGIDERTAREYARYVRAEVTTTNGQGQSAPPSAKAPGPHTGVWTPDQPALEPHPLAELFPPLAAPELAALTADIAAYGVHEAIVLFEGQILDGRNRFHACQTLGLPCPTRAYTGDDPLAYVVSLNLQRRHLNESQRAMVAAKLANMRQGARTDVQPQVNLPEVSNAKAADTLNISESLVKHAKKVQAEAQPEVIQAVETGHIAVSAAAKLAEQPVAVQRAVVQELETGAAKTVTAALQQVRGETNGHPVHPPPDATWETKAEARWRRRLPEMQRYIEEVTASRLVERLAQHYGENGYSFVLELERLIAQLQQLTDRLGQAIKARV
jgi:hypothetical protein